MYRGAVRLRDIVIGKGGERATVCAVRDEEFGRPRAATGLVKGQLKVLVACGTEADLIVIIGRPVVRADRFGRAVTTGG